MFTRTLFDVCSHTNESDFVNIQLPRSCTDPKINGRRPETPELRHHRCRIRSHAREISKSTTAEPQPTTSCNSAITRNGGGAPRYTASAVPLVSLLRFSHKSTTSLYATFTSSVEPPTVPGTDDRSCACSSLQSSLPLLTSSTYSS